MDPTLYKDLTVKRGFTYHYYCSPAAPGKPTLLFVHGFPSTSTDWARQVAYFQPKGYGLIVPDCLGYGGTSKPENHEEYRVKALAEDLMDIVDAEKPAKLVGIAHDWGCGILSAVANYYQDRFAGLAWMSLAYMPPSTEPFSIENTLKTMRELTGSDVFGYWTFFNQPDAHVISEKNIDSFLALSFASQREIWTDWVCPEGKMQEWVAANRTAPRASWITDEEYALIRNKLLTGGLKGPMNYYKAYIASVNLPDHKALPEEKWHIKVPALFVATTQDVVCKPEMGKMVMEKYAPHYDIAEIESGHWVQMEATEQLNTALEKWIEKL